MCVWDGIVTANGEVEISGSRSTLAYKSKHNWR
jgi:hypothetical protein